MGNFKLFEKRVFYGLVLGCLTTAVICWTNILFTLNQSDLPENTFFGWKKSGIYLTEILDLHPPYLGLLLVAAILFLLKEIFYDSKISRLYLCINSIAALILFAFLFNITARNSLLFLICFLLVFTFYKRLWKLLLIQLVLAAILTLVVINHPSQYYRLKLYYMLGLSDNSVKDKRFERLKASYTVFKSSPIVGVGPGHDINKKIEQYSLMKDEIAVKNRLNSHNQLFEYLAVSGIIGGIVFLGVNIYLFIFLYRSKEYFYLILLTSFLLATLTESTFERILGIQFYCIIIALGLLSRESHQLQLKTQFET